MTNVETYLTSINTKLRNETLRPEEVGKINYKFATLMALFKTLQPDAQEKFDVACDTVCRLIPGDLDLENARTTIATATWANPVFANQPYIQMMKRIWGNPDIVEVQ